MTTYNYLVHIPGTPENDWAPIYDAQIEPRIGNIIMYQEKMYIIDGVIEDVDNNLIYVKLK